VVGVVRHLTPPDPADGTVPATDDRDPALLVPHAVDEVLAAAEAWLGWDGRPVYADGNAWTPHKALRRVADHLLDHLAELECRLAGLRTLPDGWHGRRVTTDADAARFSEVDLDEATSRLTRLALCYRARLATVPAQALDAVPDGGGWTLRQIVHHVAGIAAYAEMMRAS
jgi:hypothetical protein